MQKPDRAPASRQPAAPPAFITRNFPFFDRQIGASVAAGALLLPASITISIAAMFAAFLITWRWPSTMGIKL